MIDTIVAQSTPPGPGAIAIVRLTGPTARDVAVRICPDLPVPAEPRRAYLTRMVEPGTGDLLDRGLVTVFAKPESFTGEDLVEMSCHGGWLSPTLLVDAAVQAGCRQAEPGEFTRRALLHGKLDLVQAEAILDLVDGRSRALRRSALNQLDRGLSERVGELRSALVHLEALLAHHVDFPEEDEAPSPLSLVLERAGEVVAGLDGLLKTAPEGGLLRDGAVTVLAGRPNAGKSSLFNALLGEDRAIVTPEPGTTRDAIEAVVSLGGFPFRLVDTAGIREVAGTVERLGVEVARKYLERADLVLFCVDAAVDGPGRSDRGFLSELEGTPVVVVRTKADLEMTPVGADATRDGAVATVEVSARTGVGLEELTALLPRLVFGGLVTASPDDVILTRRRHARALRLARDELERFQRALHDEIPVEVAAAHLRPAETALEELLGVISVDDVLDRVFSDFCIGK